MRKNHTRRPNMTRGDSTNEFDETTASLDGTADPSEGLDHLADLSSDDLIDEIKKNHEVESSLWFRRVVALGALSDREGMEDLPKPKHGRRVAQIAQLTGVQRQTLRHDLAIYRKIFKPHREELGTLARERLGRDVYVTANSAPDPWGALQAARTGGYTRRQFRDYVAELKGRRPHGAGKAKPGPASDYETDLASVRPYFPGRNDSWIIRCCLRLARRAARRSADRSSAPAKTTRRQIRDPGPSEAADLANG